MLNKKHYLAGAIAVLFLLSAVKAQDQPAPANQGISPTKLSLIRELVALTESRKLIDAMTKVQADQMEKELPEIIWQGVSGTKEFQQLTAEQQEDLRARVFASSSSTGRKIFNSIMEKIDFHKLIEDISVPLYDKYFTESEVGDLLAFYKSNTGKKVIEVMPALVSESMVRAGEAILPTVLKAMREIQEEETQQATKELLVTMESMPKPAKRTTRSSRKRSRP